MPDYVYMDVDGCLRLEQVFQLSWVRCDRLSGGQTQHIERESGKTSWAMLQGRICRNVVAFFAGLAQLGEM